MSSRNTAQKIIERALKLAGRGAELNELCFDLLNDMLANWAVEKKYPALRKIGPALTLSAGSSTVALPSDFGAGSDSLLLGEDKLSLNEYERDDFILNRGFPGSNTTNGRPSIYMVDQEAGLIRFNTNADQNYPVYFNYFKLPPDLANNTEKPWYGEDKVLIQGLIAEIYQFNGDVREFQQMQIVERLKAAYLRGIAPMGGGVSRVRLSPRRFRRSG